jgi:hypothetical protein
MIEQPVTFISKTMALEKITLLRKSFYEKRHFKNSSCMHG